MNSKELFALFLRIIGVWGIMHIVRHALESDSTCPVSAFLLTKWVIGALVGLYLIRGAPLVMRFAYPEKPGSPAP